VIVVNDRAISCEKMVENQKEAQEAGKLAGKKKTTSGNAKDHQKTVPQTKELNARSRKNPQKTRPHKENKTGRGKKI